EERPGGASMRFFHSKIPVRPNFRLLAACEHSRPLGMNGNVLFKGWLRVLRGQQNLNTERTENLRDLCVEALEAQRSQRNVRLVAAQGRAKKLFAGLCLVLLIFLVPTGSAAQQTPSP